MKKGIMGGTFDPIHIGHLILAETAREQFQLDEVIFIPAGNPPHKRHREGRADDAQRTEMVRRAIGGNPYFFLCLDEMEAEGYSYSYLTLERLRREHPDTEYYFIIGGDSLRDFPLWREPGRICRAAHLLAAVRDEMDGDKVRAAMENIRETFGADISLLASPMMGIASSEIRERVARGRSIRYFVPEAVRTYIEEEGIYRAGSGAAD